METFLCQCVRRSNNFPTSAVLSTQELLPVAAFPQTKDDVSRAVNTILPSMQHTPKIENLENTEDDPLNTVNSSANNINIIKTTANIQTLAPVYYSDFDFVTDTIKILNFHRKNIKIIIFHNFCTSFNLSDIRNAESMTIIVHLNNISTICKQIKVVQTRVFLAW